MIHSRPIDDVSVTLILELGGVTDDVVIKTGASCAGGYGSRASTSSPFSLTPSLQVYCLVSSYLKFY
jgi:hypothetical protein